MKSIHVFTLLFSHGGLNKEGIGWHLLFQTIHCRVYKRLSSNNPSDLANQVFYFIVFSASPHQAIAILISWTSIAANLSANNRQLTWAHLEHVTQCHNLSQLKSIENVQLRASTWLNVLISDCFPGGSARLSAFLLILDQRRFSWPLTYRHPQ